MKTIIAKNHQQRTHAVEFILNQPEGLELEIKVDKYEKPRSGGMNGYYFGFVCTPLADYCGESVEKTHENLCGEYFGWVEKEFRGHKYPKPRRTTTKDENGKRNVLKGEPFMKFVHFAESVCADMGVTINYGERAVA